jgi:hypothetical protein
MKIDRPSVREFIDEEMLVTCAPRRASENLREPL